MLETFLSDMPNFVKVITSLILTAITMFIPLGMLFWGMESDKHQKIEKQKNSD